MNAKRPEETFDADAIATIPPALRSLSIADLYGMIEISAMELSRRQGHLKAAEDIHCLVDRLLGFRPRT